jgi:acetolactate synthase-1/3 small subunit
MRHVLSALVQNVPGVLSHIAGMLASRGYNIDSLAVGETEDPRLSRMTFVVVGDDSILEQVRKQLEKIVTVVRVDDVSARDHVERDLMLIKVAAPQGRLSEIRELVEIFRAQIVDVSPEMVMIELSGKERKIEAFIELMRPFGIVELVRSGRIAMVRGQNQQQESGFRVQGSGFRSEEPRVSNPRPTPTTKPGPANPNPESRILNPEP